MGFYFVYNKSSGVRYACHTSNYPKAPLSRRLSGLFEMVRKKTSRWGRLAFLVLLLFLGASITSTSRAQADVLSAIAHCESHGHQFDSKGNVLRNKDNRHVVGVFQINERLHGAKARELGLNIYTAEGNWAYARYLLRTQGKSPWNASRHCWKFASR